MKSTRNASLAWHAQAVKAAKKQWGERQLEELEAEERLSVVCERGPVSDPVISQLREAFQVSHILTMEHVISDLMQHYVKARS